VVQNQDVNQGTWILRYASTVGTLSLWRTRTGTENDATRENVYQKNDVAAETVADSTSIPHVPNEDTSTEVLSHLKKIELLHLQDTIYLFKERSLKV